jgi:LPS export ABC transporter protein LptC
MIRGLSFSLFVVLGVYLCTSCVNDPEDVARLQARFDDKVEVAEGVEILYSDSAKLRVLVRAPIMLNHLQSTDQRQEFPDGLHVTFLDEREDTSSTLIANWGVYRRRTNQFTVRDSVVWESVDQQRLQTEELNWDEKTEEIFTNKFVILEQPGYLITGYGLKANQDFSNARVLQVDGKIPVSKPE